MASRLASGETMEVTAENIGGIDHASVRLEPGVNVLEGRNATNRTSLLQAITAALGSDRSTLKGDADEGRVDLAAGDVCLTRRLRRRNGEVVFEGDPYLEDPELADRFAFLLETNEARRAGKRGEDLREVIMEPIDTEALRSQIRTLETEKRELDAEIAELDDLADERARLETEREEIERTIETREATRAELQAEIEAEDADGAAGGPGSEALDSLREARARLEEIEYDLETERESRRQLEAERERLEAALAEIDDEDGDPLERLAGRLEELRERKRTLDGTVSELQSVIQFNEARLGDGGLRLEVDEGEKGADVPTDRLVDDAITCWTCGSAVEREAVAETLERLRSLHASKLDERAELETRIAELAEREEARRGRRERRERLTAQLDDVAGELATTAERIESLEAARADQHEAIAELEGEVDGEGALESVLETQRELTQVELELERHRERLADVEARLEELSARLDERDEVVDRREAVSERLTELRTRVDRIEREAVDSFNEHVAAILGILEYGNIDRIWIERRERDGPAERHRASESAFDLHVVRSTEDGATYEDTLAHLSESEREVTGLVFALAGFLAHEVYETVPVMLLDSLEAIDAERIAALVDYFEDYVDCLVVALLPEDAAALPDDYTYHREF